MLLGYTLNLSIRHENAGRTRDCFKGDEYKQKLSGRMKGEGRVPSETFGMLEADKLTGSSGPVLKISAVDEILARVLY